MEWWRGENRLENGKERKDEERQKGKRVPLPLSGAGALSNQIITMPVGVRSLTAPAGSRHIAARQPQLFRATLRHCCC